MDRRCSAGHEPDRSGVGAPGGPRGEMGMGTARGAGRRLPVAGGPKPAAAAVVSARRRPASLADFAYAQEYYVRSYPCVRNVCA